MHLFVLFQTWRAVGVFPAGVNARLFDNFVAADAPVVVIDGKNLW